MKIKDCRKKRNGFLFLIGLLIITAISSCKKDKSHPEIGLTLIPPATVTNKINLDIRAGIKNKSEEKLKLSVSFYLDEEIPTNKLFDTEIQVEPNLAEVVKFLMPTQNHEGKHEVIVKIEGENFTERKSKTINILNSATRSTKTIGGAWISFYHWSEEEGKMWNPEIKKLTDEQWKETIASMHEIGMDVVVIQESFRNQEYVGKHKMGDNNYTGKAFYPSKLFSQRMPIAAKDPIEAVLSEADRLGMHVFMGVGMYAWFDYSPGSLAWHKKVAKELYEMYGEHPSFYGFYVSEEGMGSLDCFETDSIKQIQRRAEVLNFFKEFKPFCKQLAPDKPVMFAPNGWGVARAGNAYYDLLKNVDIICPFAFNRMPEGDLTGKEAISLLQKYCNQNDAHLWFDLEAFLFNEKEGYLYPRPMKEIKDELALYDTFEKVICYQYPGVFSNPKTPYRVGEDATVQLFKDYKAYIDSLSNKF